MSETGSTASPEAVDHQGREILVVDLDRTLAANDFTLENILGVIGKNPLNIPRVLAWAARGRSVLKARCAGEGIPSVALAPYNPECIAFIEAARAGGAYVVLASASNQAIVDAVAAHTGLFDAAHGSSEGDNFKGRAKADFLDRTYGRGNYTYMGDSPADAKVWSRARRAVTVGASGKVRAMAEKAAPGAEHIETAARSGRNQARAVIKTLRPHQWSKNILILVPLLAAQALTLPNILMALLAFACFSLTASSVYILNDMLDLDADRAHPRKCRRPFATGVLPIKAGLVLAPLLLAGSFAMAVLFLPLLFVLVLAGYYAATLSYSLFLKRKIMVDVFTLAALYTFRIVAGAAAVSIALSQWLIGFSLFFFLALAIVKRLSELADMIRRNEAARSKRDYYALDLGMVQSIGAASAYAAILVLTLYFSSPAATDLYRSPEILWGVSPLLLYWISRMLVLANRGEMDDDPIVFAAKDRTSLLVGLCIFGVILASEYFDWRVLVP